ncbi:MAG TPA: NAD(P)/FAD-dependent oxidoreductase [Dissulfurispiraceae bacterium]|nr:NAD(P)/FAD-dependent oxidoreductase [Dissulfurispiraceae bacterium]
MATFDFDIGIIGGGSAGLTAAAGSSQLGANTLLVEREGRLGGDCLHYGCVPSKALIKIARVRHLIKSSSRFGLPEVELEKIDFNKVTERIKSVISKIQKHDSVERFCRLGTRVEFGAPEFVDEHSIRLNGQTISARNWLIATGSSPNIPVVRGMATARYITNREIFYLDRLPSSMIILGGGPIGVEMAQAFNRLGSKVFVIQRAGQLLPREDKDMADSVMAVLASEGVIFHLNASVSEIKDFGDSCEVTLKSGDERTVINAETILVATGRRPNTDGLGLERVGVQFDEKGIKVDNRMRTHQKHIYAAGDVTGGYLFTHAAGYEGGVAVSNAIFHLPRKVDYTFFPWCTYTDPELGCIGLNETAAKSAGIEYSVWTEEFSANDRSIAEGYEVGRIKLVLNEKEGPVGVQIFGPHAGDLVGEWTAALNGRVRLSTLASSVHPYPTIAEINKKVVSNFLSTKIFSEKIRKGLKFFFNLRGRACEL